MREKVVLLVWLLYIILEEAQGELRFCLNGPHKMQESDCPGGFVFKASTQPTCKYYAKTNGSRELILSAPTDVCSDDTTRAIEWGGDDLKDIDSLTWFMWEKDEDPPDTNEMGQFEPEGVCEQECLPDWEDTSYVEDDPPSPDSWDHSKETPEDKKTTQKFNKELFINLLIDHDPDTDPAIPAPLPVIPEVEPPPPPDDEPEKTVFWNPPVSTLIPRADHVGFRSEKKTEIYNLANSLIASTMYNTKKLNIVKLLARSMKIIMAACAPYLNEDFYEQVLKGMMFISKMFTADIVDIGQDLYKELAERLDHCGLRRHQEFQLNGTKCEGMEKVEGIYYTKKDEYWKYRLTKRSFRWGKYHPLFDAAWTTVDFIHSFCFESFLGNMMLGHVYEVAMEGLFPKNISLLWRSDPGVQNDKFWNNVLQTSDLNVTMRNLDACAVGALKYQAPFKDHLPRPFLTLEEIRMPQPQPASGSESQYPKGWNQTIGRYWQNYEKLGGFKELSKSFGRCFQKEDYADEKDEMIKTLQTDKPC